MAPEASREVYAAIEILCSSPEPTAVRLGTSYQLHLRGLDADDLPPSVRPDFRAILEELRRLFPTPDRFDGVDEQTAAEASRRLLLAYDRLLGSAKRPR